MVDGIIYIAQNKYRNEIWWFIRNRKFFLDLRIRFIEEKWMEDAILTAQLFCVSRIMAHLHLGVLRHLIIPLSDFRNKNPEHYKKVIFDDANAVYVFKDLL